MSPLLDGLRYRFSHLQRVGTASVTVTLRLSTNGGTLNYYPFHLGDYAAHTAHLEPMEDLAYRRMLDLYYRTEKALPECVEELSRLLRLRDQVGVVKDILREFFHLSADGWHSKRADAELTSMLAKQEQKSTKDEHEAERMRRHRERRAELFSALRVLGVVPAWDVPMKELQRLHDEASNAPETRLKREQVISPETPATAIPTPTPTPTPTPILKREREGEKSRAVALALPPDVDSQVWSDWVQLRKAKKAPVTQTVIEGARIEALKAGMPLEAFLREWCARGSQGLKADWLKPAERAGPSGSNEPDWVVEKRDRMAQFAGDSAAKPIRAANVIDMGEIFDANKLD